MDVFDFIYRCGSVLSISIGLILNTKLRNHIKLLDKAKDTRIVIRGSKKSIISLKDLGGIRVLENFRNFETY